MPLINHMHIFDHNDGIEGLRKGLPRIDPGRIRLAGPMLLGITLGGPIGLISLYGNAVHGRGMIRWVLNALGKNRFRGDAPLTDSSALTPVDAGLFIRGQIGKRRFF